MVFLIKIVHKMVTSMTQRDIDDIDLIEEGEPYRGTVVVGSGQNHLLSVADQRDRHREK